MSEAAESAIVFTAAGASMVAVLHAPATAGRAAGIVFIVGGPQYRAGSHRQFVLMARGFARQGFPVLRFDYRGMGDSDGDHPGFDGCAEDIRSAIDVLLRECPHLQSVTLFGLCDGASAALMYGVTDARVDRLILANPWVRTASTEAATQLRHYYWKRVLQRSFWEKLIRGSFGVRKSLTEFAASVKRARTASGAEHAEKESFVLRMRSAMQAFQGQVLVLLSGRDLTAKEFQDVCAADKLWRGAMERQGVTRQDLIDADHTFSERAALEAAVKASADWLTSQVPSGARAAMTKVA
jgi:exosortase A-associated hydrolase 1